jgi:glycogen phosphorylase
MMKAIEEEVVPLYYDRNAQGLSPEWVRRSRHAMASVIPSFNMRRTVGDYAAGMYGPAAYQGARLMAGNGQAAGMLAEWKRRVRERWDGVRIASVSDEPRGVAPDAPLRMRARVHLGGLLPADLRVEFKARRLLPDAQFDLAPLCSFGHGIPNGQWRAEFSSTGSADADGAVTFEVSAVPPATGQYQLEVRVYPWHELLTHPLEMGLMKSL